MNDRNDTADTTLNRRRFLGATGMAAVTIAGYASTRWGPGRPDDGANTGLEFGYGGVPVVGRAAASVADERSSESLSASAELPSRSTAEAEPNDVSADATAILTDTAVSGSLDRAEVDWFAFDVEADTDLQISLGGGASGGVVALAYYDHRRDFVDQVYADASTTVRLEETATGSGTHYVQVVNVEDGNAEYTLTVSTRAESTQTETATPTATATPAETVDDYGVQGYGEYGYGGVEA